MMRIGKFVMLTVLSGCVVGEDLPVFEPEEPEPPEEPTPVASSRLVLEPVNGSIVVGDPSTSSVRVAGVFAEPDQQVSVQILANPNDMTSWQTIATTTTVAELARATFSVDVRPVASAAEQQRWPRGGVLRLRVIDAAGTALPFDEATPDDSVIAIANPAELPATWRYLSERPAGSVAETLEYYAVIDAPLTLDAFMARFGFPGGETTAIYYNAGDLGIGREMHCRATQVPAGGLACYVRNYGTFGGLREDAIAQTVAGGIPLATVAMVYTPPITAPNAVSFMVYGPDGALVTEAPLDTHGDNTSIPQNCLNCHGGRSRYDDATSSVIGARFLPFDPSAFVYPQRADLTFLAQEGKLRELNRLVAGAAPTAGVRTLIDGMFRPGEPFDPAFVPVGWSDTKQDRNVYRIVIAPYCRGCHVSFETAGGDDPLAFDTAASLRARAGLVVARLCGDGPLGMPTAEVTTAEFFRSPARAVLLQWLGQPGACAPVTELPPQP